MAQFPPVYQRLARRISMEDILREILGEIKGIKSDIGELRTGQVKMGARLDGLEKGQHNLEVRFGDLEKAQRNLEVRFDGLEEAQRNLGVRFDGLEEAQNNLATRLDGLEQGQLKLVTRIDSLEKGQNGLVTCLDGFGQGLLKLATRIDGLEKGQRRVEAHLENEVIGKIRVLFDAFQSHEERLNRIESRLEDVSTDIRYLVDRVVTVEKLARSRSGSARGSRR